MLTPSSMTGLRDSKFKVGSSMQVYPKTCNRTMQETEKSGEIPVIETNGWWVNPEIVLCIPIFERRQVCSQAYARTGCVQRSITVMWSGEGKQEV
jgi:hypothetical protein